MTASSDPDGWPEHILWFALLLSSSRGADAISLDHLIWAARS